MAMATATPLVMATVAAVLRLVEAPTELAPQWLSGRRTGAVGRGYQTAQ
jgi:hypothetical protein